MKQGRGGNLLLYGVAGLCGVLAAAFAYAYLEKRLADQRQALQQEPAPVAEQQLAEVVVAAGDVLRGERLAEEDLRVLQVPAAGVRVDDVVTDPDRAVGRVALGDLYTGEWLVERKLAAPDDPRKGLASLLDPARRAIRIPVDPVSGLLGILEPDDRVDVVGVFASANGDRTIGRTLLQNVPVLAVGQHGVPGGQADPQAARQEQAARREGTVTLEVTRQQAETVALALGVGKVQLALRNDTDPAQPPSDGVDTRRLERVTRTSAPEPETTDPRRTVQVLHGGESDQQVVTR